MNEKRRKNEEKEEGREFFKCEIQWEMRKEKSL